MASVVQPDLIPQPWSQNGSHTTIPDTTSEFGRASWALGFPPETALPLNAGGIPPNWLDFQGVLYALSQHATFEQVGGRYTWSSSQNYPAGACILGSNGMVYQALQESGPGTSAGAKNPTSSGSSAYWGALATPDGSTIKLTNGKLAVNLSGVADGTTIVAANNKLSVSAAGIADGTTIVDNNGKLTAVGGGGGGDASSLADGETIIASSNKLVVNLASAPAAKLKNINQYLIASGGGLLMDATTGKLAVDFPTLHLPLWIGDSGIGTEFYVDDANGTDTTSGEQGRSAATPWKTISYAAEQICQNYNINNKTVHINVAGGDYTNRIELPMQQRTTGSIIIRPKTDSDTVNLKITVTGNQKAIIHSGGVWTLQDLNIITTWGTQTSASGTNPGAIQSTDSTGSLTVEHCNLSFIDSTVAPVSGTYGNVEPKMILSSGGYIILKNKTGALSATWSGTDSHATTVWIMSENSGAILLARGGYTYTVSGKFTTFCSVGAMSYVRPRGSGTIVAFAESGTVTGKRYNLYDGGTVTTGSNNAATYFPGSTAGSLDSSTYCWIK